MVIVPGDPNSPMDNLDANYQLLKVIKDAIVDWNRNSKIPRKRDLLFEYDLIDLLS